MNKEPAESTNNPSLLAASNNKNLNHQIKSLNQKGAKKTKLANFMK
jgi:hypothetical protein